MEEGQLYTADFDIYCGLHSCKCCFFRNILHTRFLTGLVETEYSDGISICEQRVSLIKPLGGNIAGACMDKPYCKTWRDASTLKRKYLLVSITHTLYNGISSISVSLSEESCTDQ